MIFGIALLNNIPNMDVFEITGFLLTHVRGVPWIVGNIILILLNPSFESIADVDVCFLM